MKHTLRLIAILLVIVLLAGCTENTADPTDTTSQITDNFVDSVKNDFRGDVSGDWVMQRVRWAGVFSDDGYYYTTPKGFLYFYDPASMLSVRLCSDVNCLHEEETQYEIYENCDAFIGGLWEFNIFFVTNETLYYILTDYYGTHLYSRDLAGMNEKLVASLAQNYWRPDRSLEVKDAVVLNGKLYYTADAETTVWLEEEQTNYLTREFSVICCLDLETGEETELVRTGSNEQLGLVAASDDAILCTVVVDNSTEGSINRLFTLVLHSTKGLGSRILLQSNNNRSSGCYIQDGVFYEEEEAEDGTVSLLGYDLLTSEIKYRTQVPESGLQYLNEKFRLQYTWSHGETFSIYDISTGEFLDGSVKGKAARVYNTSDMGFVLKATLFDEETDEYKEAEVFYCSFDSLEDGFQKEDLQFIMSTKNE